MSTLGQSNPVNESSTAANALADKTLAATTATQLTVTATPCRCVLVTSDPTNTAGHYIRVAGPTVDATHGQKLAPGQTYTITIDDASKVWLYADTGSQVVQATVFT